MNGKFLVDDAGTVINPDYIATAFEDAKLGKDHNGQPAKFGSGRAVVILADGSRVTLKAKYTDLAAALAPTKITPATAPVKTQAA